MRITLTIEERLARDLKEIARRSGKPFEQVVNETLHAGLNAGKAPRRARRYSLKPASLGQPLPGIDLDKALQLADALESLVLTAKRREWRMQSEEPLPVVLDAILRMLAHRQRRLS